MPKTTSLDPGRKRPKKPLTERRSRNGIPFTQTRVEGPFFVGAAQKEPSSLGSAPAPAAEALSWREKGLLLYFRTRENKGRKRGGGDIDISTPHNLFSFSFLQTPLLRCSLGAAS